LKEAANMSNSQQIETVQKLIQQEKFGVLSTLSVKHEGWPFGSTTPYAISASGDPIILVSSLAEHTKNMMHDPRVSLFIQDTTTDANPQSLARATMLGIVESLNENEVESAAQQYLLRFPEAAQNFQMGGFSLLRIVVKQVRYIGGFGEMFWINMSL
jgi:heme iron utilization protein